MRRERWAGALFAAAGLLVACGDDEPAASSSTTVEATGSTSTTAVPSTEATGTEGPVTFESAHYPVALRLPAGVEDGSWVDARRPWDGVQGIDMAGPFVDVVFLPSRSLFFFGTDTSDDLEAFVATVAGSATRRHQCSEPQNRRDVVVAEIPAVAYSQTCELDAVFARVALVHDGFGLVVFSPTIVGQEVAALDEIISSLDGLELRTS
jgi:hypothetical protein